MFEPPLDLNGACILFVNDDGIRASGLKALERLAKSFLKDVWVFVPEEEQSGTGYSLSLYKSVRISRISAHLWQSNRLRVDGAHGVYVG